MPAGLARELVSSSGGSAENLGGNTALVNSSGGYSGMLGSKGSGDPTKLNEQGGVS